MFKPVYSSLIIVVTSLLIYGKSLQNDFVQYDDHKYVYQNKAVVDFDLNALLTKPFEGNYHPVTMLTLATEYAFFGDHANGFHFISLLLHILCSIAVYFFVRRLTNDDKIGFITALLFAIHPMHVESVAWISARKDLLYTLFYLLGLFVYLAYLKDPKWQILLLVGLLFVLSLFSKAMAVTFPLILLLVDYYKGRKFNSRTILEKVPFFVIAIAMGMLTMVAQENVTKDSSVNTFGERLLFSGYSIVTYFWKAFVPVGQTIAYAYPPLDRTIIIYIIALLALIGILVWKYKERNYLFGGLFFIVNILLVLKIVQDVGVGIALAERYTYLSYLGLFFIIATIAARHWNAITTAVLVIWIVLLGAAANLQTRVWTNTKTLWLNAYEQNSRSYEASAGLASVYLNEQKIDSALYFYHHTIALDTNDAVPYYNLASGYYQWQQFDSVLHYVNLSFQHGDNSADSYFLRAKAYEGKQLFNKAIGDMKQSTKLQPENALAFNELGIFYYRTAQYDSAITAFDAAIALDPKFMLAIKNRGIALSAKSAPQDSVRSESQ